MIPFSSVAFFMELTKNLEFARSLFDRRFLFSFEILDEISFDSSLGRLASDTALERSDEFS